MPSCVPVYGLDLRVCIEEHYMRADWGGVSFQGRIAGMDVESGIASRLASRIATTGQRE